MGLVSTLPRATRGHLGTAHNTLTRATRGYLQITGAAPPRRRAGGLYAPFEPPPEPTYRREDLTLALRLDLTLEAVFRSGREHHELVVLSLGIDAELNATTGRAALVTPPPPTPPKTYWARDSAGRQPVEGPLGQPRTADETTPVPRGPLVGPQVPRGPLVGPQVPRETSPRAKTSEQSFAVDVTVDLALGERRGQGQRTTEPLVLAFGVDLQLGEHRDHLPQAERGDLTDAELLTLVEFLERTRGR